MKKYIENPMMISEVITSSGLFDSVNKGRCPRKKYSNSPACLVRAKLTDTLP